MTPTPPTEDLAQLITRVMGEKSLTQTAVAERAGISTSTLNAWVNRRRGHGGRGPSSEKLRALAAALGEPEHQVFAAAARRVPGDMSKEKQERLLELFGQLTEEQQEEEFVVIELKASRNRTGT